MGSSGGISVAGTISSHTSSARRIGIVGHGGGQEPVDVVDQLPLLHPRQRADVAGELGVTRVYAIEDPGLGHDAYVDGGAGGAEGIGARS